VHLHAVALSSALVASVALLAPGPADAQGPRRAPDPDKDEKRPLVIAKQGSFFVHERNIETSFPNVAGTPTPVHISVKGMYVQYQIPKKLKKRGAYPVVMVHGSGHTGKTYEETPDGREGWATYFVRQGIPAYVVDHSGRARSGFDPTPVNQARAQSNATLLPETGFNEFSNEAAWTTFRIGPAPFEPHPTTQFPVGAADEYFAQVVPNTETTYPEGGQNTIDALAQLLDTIGPAVVMVHSQSGRYGLQVALARPALVKAVVSVEPRTCELTDEQVSSVFAHVPLLTVFGDLFDDPSVGNWGPIMEQCIETVGRIEAAGGRAENLYLPDAGFVGNSHMLMMDRNNLEIADWILEWLDENVGRKTRGR
jgi:pimeloyl-ACP methyl ester carboxylesterase